MEPLVSIVSLSYNHEPFIRKALDGFLMQKTNFPFEVVIHDDASTDKTQEIIKEYESKYPDIIKPIYQVENQKSKGSGIVTKTAFAAAKGKYIALCEGDDFWIDPFKLQKQVDFLEENPDYGLTHGDCNFLYEKDKTTLSSANKSLGLVNDCKGDTEKLFDLLIDASYKIRTATVMLRKDLFDDIKDDLAQISRKFLMGDIPLWLLMSRRAKFHYFQDVFATYRIANNTASRPKSKKDKVRFQLSMLEMRLYFLREFGKPIPEKVSKGYNQTLLRYKSLNPSYEEQYALVHPTKTESFSFQNINSHLVQRTLRFIFNIQDYQKSILHKLKSLQIK